MIGLLIATTLLAAPQASPPAAPTTQAAAPDADALAPGQRRTKMVCRMETPTGTRFAKRVCLSQEDLEQRERDAREGMQEIQLHPPTCCATIPRSAARC